MNDYEIGYETGREDYRSGDYERIPKHSTPDFISGYHAGWLQAKTANTRDSLGYIWEVARSNKAITC